MRNDAPAIDDPAPLPVARAPGATASTDLASTHRNLAGAARGLRSNWAGKLLGRPGGVGLKLFKVDAAGLASEMHPAYDEALLMLEGQAELSIDGVRVALQAGDLQVIPAGAWHEILPGGQGSFLLVDPEP